MKIAMIASNAERVPPRGYGGTERVVYALTEQLVKRGHEVTLFASGDSQTSAKLIASSPYALRNMRLANPYAAGEWLAFNAANAYARQDEFDIIHDHNHGMHFTTAATAQLAKTPVLMTLHGPFADLDRKIFTLLKKPFINSISKAQIKDTKNLNYIGNIYHGLDMDQYPSSNYHDNYLLFVGRLALDKSPHHAIEVAEKVRLPLIMAAKLDNADRDYFEEFVESKLSSPYVNWIGEVQEEERNILMSRARCLVHPVHFAEPFGLVMIEAMACGCPVVAFNKGSIPEIVVNGKTGFVVDTADEMVEAIKRIGEIDRAECRRYALEKFSSLHMAKEYEKLYKKILAKIRD